ncbi:hypothetical protein Tco_0887634 [Tanacetum coccineum]
MVSYLKKTEGSDGFHQIVDFLNTSHIRYALTENPTIYVSLKGEHDGKVKTVSEASIRKHLKLEDSDVDEAASTSVDVRLGRATTTVTSLEARQGSGNIDKTLTMPHDSPLPRVNTLRSDEGGMKLQELMVLCTKLSTKVDSLEADLKQTKQIYGAAFTKLIKKVKTLEKTIKSSEARRKARIIYFLVFYHK